MGGQLLKAGVQMRRAVIFTLRTCYRIGCGHPFLVGMLCFFMLLYRSFPFLFSILVSVSPVVVCTAVLLGTLLSFGQPNIPEIEKEEVITHETLSSKVQSSRDATFIERNDSCSVEYSDRKGNVVEQSVGEPIADGNKTGEAERDHSFAETPQLIEEMPGEGQFQNRIAGEVERELSDLDTEYKSEMNEVLLGDRELLLDQYSPILKLDSDNLELDNDKSVDSFDSKRVNVDSPPGSPWKHMEDEGEEEEDEDEDEDEDSGSDRAESSSPDASMADIMPMLDELHPLLDDDAPLPVHLSHDGSDAGSEHSPRSSVSNDESDENSENQEDLERPDDENDGEDEETHGDGNDQAKSAISWTEEDQKNLMDLGSSELERNQRLESLIARRRARKSMRIMAEKNLIDIESVDIPFNVAPISTTRRNPFDLPHDSYDDLGLPPIPGSAPSILLPRRNPFDIPYDSSEEKPDLMGDSFQQEFMTFQAKDTVFRRHESFNVGPSMFGPNKTEKQDIRLRPYFVPDRLGSEGTSYSRFYRQSSELSDSKVSSVPETESLGSAGDLEESVEQELFEEEEQSVIEENNSPEPEVIANIEHAAEHVGHGSQSSDVESLELDEVEQREIVADEIEIKLGDVENHYEMESGLSIEGSADAVENHAIAETVEQNYHSDSSSSSLSEPSERIFVEKEPEGLAGSEGDSLVVEQPHILPQPSLEVPEFANALADDASLREPVYDSSPSAAGREFVANHHLLAPSSSAYGSIEEPVHQYVIHHQSENQVSTSTFEPGINISADDTVDQLRESSANSSQGQNVTQLEDEKRSCSLDQDQFVQSDSPSFDSLPKEESSTQKEVTFQSEEHQVHCGTSDASANSSQGQNVTQLEAEKQSSSVDQDLFVQSASPSFDSLPKEESSTEMEVTFQSEEHLVHSGTSDVNMDGGTHQQADKVVSLDCQDVTEGKSMSQSDGMVSSDDSTDESPSKDQQEDMLIAAEEAKEEPSTRERVHYLENEVSASSVPESISISYDEFCETKKPSAISDLQNSNLQGDVPQSIDHAGFPEETTDTHIQSKTIAEEMDEIKEFDEALLSELDTVGDFRVEQAGLSSALPSVGESISLLHDADKFTAEFVQDESTRVLETEHVKQSQDLSVEDIDKYTNDVECVSELQKSEKHDLEKADLPIRELSGQENASPVVLGPSDEDPSPKENAVRSAETGESQNLDGETDSPMPVFEGHSVETEAVMVKESGILPEGHVMEDSVSGNELLEVEARALEDIELAFRQTTQTKEPFHAKLTLEETTSEHPEDRSDSGLVVNKELNPVDGSAEVEVNEAGNPKAVESSAREIYTGETNKDAIDKPGHEAKMSDNLSQITSDTKSKTKDFTKSEASSSSSSNSSSSSSSSDSDKD